MLTRIEIHGFKSFDHFSLDLSPFTAIVGPNASGKSNLFDAVRFISLLAENDIRSAMEGLRGEPEELFRKTPAVFSEKMCFAVEVLLDRTGSDGFGKAYELKAQRLRYELCLTAKRDRAGRPQEIFVSNEECRAIAKKEDRARFLSGKKLVRYNARLTPFIRISEGNAIEIKQDGGHGHARKLPLANASRTGLSTINTAEFPHLFALKDMLLSTRFLEINPQAARRPSDRFETRTLKPDASNLSAVLTKIRDETRSNERPSGALADIAADLTSLVSSVRSVVIKDDSESREYSFSLELSDKLQFSSRVISDGTLRLLALLTVLNDPSRKGLLCFEEPENGVHEGRIASLVHLMRDSVSQDDELGSDAHFQIIINTHSPAVMNALKASEIVAAETVTRIDPLKGTAENFTRMRSGIQEQGNLFNPEEHLSRAEVSALLNRLIEAA